jgi:hypothetical protein
MIDGSGSGSVSPTKGYGSGRPKYIWILRIRIRNTAKRLSFLWPKSTYYLPNILDGDSVHLALGIVQTSVWGGGCLFMPGFSPESLMHAKKNLTARGFLT